MPVPPIQPTGLATPLVPSAAVPKPVSPTTGFGEALGGLLDAVEATGAQANDAVARMLAGEGDVHTALIAMQQADTTFQLSVQVRNKIVQAYQDIMRMPV